LNWEPRTGDTPWKSRLLAGSGRSICPEILQLETMRDIRIIMTDKLDLT